MSLQGKVALITGGTKNLGAEIARQLASCGADLALHYNTEASRAEGAQLVRELGGGADKCNKIKLYQADLRTEAAVNALFDQTVADFGKVDLVVNTVGKVLKKAIGEVTEDEYDDMFAINTKSAFFILKASAKHVTDGGKIINIVTALLGAFTGLYTSYAGSKAPVEHFTRGVAKELLHRGVSVNSVAPGPMDTRVA
ncbi:hypothetical protein XA68_16851 [Ophiocordyceps unilateralis]|uniref:Uncharacterized protein n=1 Tax=Ophiocordyceps unilateralis TaxID=268505 RepID=A0A2A9P5S6_OPHUN|nr:hypothetical protein XA68_16851 [Ophiocordyceps unilateralis]